MCHIRSTAEGEVDSSHQVGGSSLQPFTDGWWGVVEASVLTHPSPYTLHPAPFTLHSTPFTLHPTPHTLHPELLTLHPSPQILHSTPFNLLPKPLTLHRKSDGRSTEAAWSADVSALAFLLLLSLFLTLVTGPGGSFSLKPSDTKVYEPVQYSSLFKNFSSGPSWRTRDV